jgi:hypothetical protein
MELPGKRGKPAGTASQMRPHSLSLCPSAAPEPLGEVDGGASLGAALDRELADGLGDGPHVTRRRLTAATNRRRLDRIGIGRV